MNTRSTPAAVVVAILLLAGCAQAPAPTDDGATPTAPVVESPTPTPEPTQEQETGLVRPAQVFEGDCDSVFSIDELKAILGSSIAPSGDPEVTGEFVPPLLVEQVSGVNCSWATKNYTNGLVVTVLPAAAVTSREAKQCAKGDLEFNPNISCQMESEINDIRLSGIAWFGKGNAAINGEKTAKLVEIFESKAAAATAVPLPIPADGAWQNPAECSLIEPLLGNPGMLNGTDDLQVYQGGGSDAYFTPAESELNGFIDDQDQVQCAITTADPNRVLTKDELAAGMIRSAGFGAVGGAAWAQELIAEIPGTQEITIPGVERALLIKSENGTRLAVFDGPNYLQVTFEPGTSKKTYSSIALVLKALNEGPVG